MKPTILFLTLIGLTLFSARQAEAQTFQTASPAPLDAPHVLPRPYYVSEAVNGNEAYPKVSTDDAAPTRVGTTKLRTTKVATTDWVPATKAEAKSDSCYNCGHVACYCPPVIQLELDWLSMSRGNNAAASNIIGGPDTANFGDLGFTRDSGYRVRGAVGLWDWELEGVYSNMNPWTANSTRQLTRGVSFDEGVNFPAAWLGQNFINQNTLFSPIFAAATGGLAADEFDGFGPGDGRFLGDTPPTLATTYRSELDIIEANLRPRDYVRYMHGGWRVGMGFAHVTLDEFASASLTGTFRALDVGGGPFSGGLTNLDLTNPAGGNLSLISGPGTGFDDQTGGTQAPNPDALTFLYEGAVDNTMNGVQLLFDGLLYENRHLRINSSLKAGVYDNHVQGSIRERYTEVTSDGDVYGRDFTNDTHQVAFLGTVGLAGSYGIWDWLHVRGGYEVNFLSGIALAPDQAVTSGGYVVNADSSLITHGFNLGIEGRY